MTRTLSQLYTPRSLRQCLPSASKESANPSPSSRPKDNDLLISRRPTEVLDRALTFITGISRAGLQSNRFLNGLIGYIKTYHLEVIDHLTKQVQEGGRIVLPGQFPRRRPRT